MSVIPQPAPDSPTSDAITISPFYHSAVNEITKPNSLVFISHYFARKWAPDLGALGVAIVICLRDQCYHDRQKGDKRDLVKKFPVRGVARACQVSEKTIRREFDRNTVLKKFVVEEYEYKPGRVAGSVLEDAYSYRVAMDDPIHPTDEQRLLEIVRAKAIAQEKGNNPNTREAAKQRARRAAEEGYSTPGQFDQASPICPGGLVKLTGGADNLSGGAGQIVQASIVIESFGIPENPLNPSSEDSLSLFSEEDPDRTGPSTEEIAAVRAAIVKPQEPPRPPKVAEIQSEWDAMTPEGRDAFRPESVRQLIADGQHSPPEAMVLPRMFRLFWAQRKGIEDKGSVERREI